MIHLKGRQIPKRVKSNPTMWLLSIMVMMILLLQHGLASTTTGTRQQQQCVVGFVEKFVLLDGNSNAVRVVSHNDSVCIHKNWKIRAVTRPCRRTRQRPIGSVRLSYKSATKSFAATDNVAPFELMLPMLPGNTTTTATTTVRIAATPFGQRNLKGRTGKTISIILNLRNCPNITSSSEKCTIKGFRHDGKLLLNGDSICREADQPHTLQAIVECPTSSSSTTNTTIKKVVLQLNSAKHNVTTTEYNAPYTVRGPAGVLLPVGSYELRATPYYLVNDNNDKLPNDENARRGVAKVIRFSVTKCNENNNDPPTPAPQFTDYGRPTPAPQFTDYGRPTPAPQFTDYGRPTKAPTTGISNNKRVTETTEQDNSNNKSLPPVPTPAPQFTDYARPTPVPLDSSP